MCWETLTSDYILTQYREYNVLQLVLPLQEYTNTMSISLNLLPVSHVSSSSRDITILEYRRYNNTMEIRMEPTDRNDTKNILQVKYAIVNYSDAVVPTGRMLVVSIAGKDQTGIY